MILYGQTHTKESIFLIEVDKSRHVWQTRCSATYIDDLLT